MRSPHSFRQYWQEISPWWRSEDKKTAWLGLAVLIGMSIFSIYMAVILNDWTKDFFNTLEARDLKGFMHQVLIYVPIVALVLLDFCTRNYLTAWLSFRWRRWMTNQLSSQWLDKKHYYLITQDNGPTDNPDQRIAIDLQEIAEYTVSLFAAFFREGINFVTFSIILWGMSSNIAMRYFGVDLNIPGFLVWAAILYSSIGILIIFKIGGPLIGLSRQQERCEADFRYRLMRTFEYREEIACLSGEGVEKQTFFDAFTAIRKNYYTILKYRIYINLFQNFYLNAGMFIPLFIVGPAYFAGGITMGILMQTRSMFQEVSSSLLTIVTSFNSIAALLAALQRVIDFKSHMAAAAIRPLPRHAPSHLEIRGLQLTHADGEVFWDVPPICIRSGDRKILMAPSGSGKTSLLRILAGLKDNYTPASGIIALPHTTMFVPQRAYMPVGTLRQCLAYPSEHCEAATLLNWMRICHLEHLIPQLDLIQDYQHTLSLGEQQRVNFVRIFMQQPQWLIMDEPTAHLNKEYANELCALLAKHLPQTGILAISHALLPEFSLLEAPV